MIVDNVNKDDESESASRDTDCDKELIGFVCM